MDFDQPIHPYWFRSLQLLGTLATADPFGRKFLGRMDALFDAMRSQGAVWQFQPLRQALLDVGWAELTAEDIADHAEKIMLGKEEPWLSPSGTKVWEEIAADLKGEVARGELVAWEPRPIPAGYTAGPRANPRDSIPPLIAELRKLGADVTVSNSPADEAAIGEAETSLGFALPEWLKAFYRDQGSMDWSWDVELVEGDSADYIPSYDHQHVYGLTDALRRTGDYQRELAEFADYTELPKRLVVISEVDGDNAAWGIVYDADRNALLRVMGGKGIDGIYEQMNIWDLIRSLLTRSRNQLQDAKAQLGKTGTAER